MMSLRLRLLLGAIAGIVVALAITAYILIAAFQNHVRDRYIAELDSHLDQLAAAFKPGVKVKGIARPNNLTYALFELPLSGYYWQVNEAGRALWRSKSLWDEKLDLRLTETDVTRRQVGELVGPRLQPLISVERVVFAEDNNFSRELRLIVAGERRIIDEPSREFMTTVFFSLAVIGGLLVLASWFQVRAGLAPLRGLGRQLEALRKGHTEQLEGRFPEEIADVAEALNRLLSAQAREVQRARANAGKLGHGLKTPLAVLAAECRALAGRGEADAARSIEKEIDEMNGHIARVIAAARSVGPRQAVGTRTEVAPVLGRMVSVMKRLPRGGEIIWRIKVDPGDLSLPIDSRDLDEVFGNLLDNARKWARSRVEITVSPEKDLICVCVEDDGPGIPEDRLQDVLAGGFRLDRAVPGSGIGLAIACELAQLHGGTLKIGPGELGGTKVSLYMAGDASEQG